ncbi:hypothetical protein SDRG_12305 [Saprolegnia diclina VS20]|uniref:N-acetyltransferase domain-containing protein n=1 Tax=Saprolegnia diclina (strain VS20) TaxID=1156394 RepID=T0Q990_SAPDV|nr:hypothetical protein SDRG_12305 [Saprolegnia diclina VS20]EQC30025.1 hypothetical protein SDRG_12305 [Saprolegnia diclina VS20]|eukprot:XP_008616592.1 hypothetical protein SDRG_12305 [Saprolegnia diclina VS20]
MFRLVEVGDAEAAHAIEAASYPVDEAASLAQIQARLADASGFFFGAYASDGALVGFVNGTLAAERELTAASLSTHDPSGRFLCIYSVVVEAAHRCDGLGAALLRAYLAHVQQHHPYVDAIVLLAKPALVQWYVRCGFAVTRLSPVVHGQDTWLELVFDCVAAQAIDVVQVDAFARKAFEGNPAAVVVLTPTQFFAPGAATWMQQVALERNLSETAFVAPHGASLMDFHLRWFKPAKEVVICGHATLAAAYTLYVDGHCAKDAPIRFHTKSGVLTTRYVTQPDGIAGIEMDFPTMHFVARDEAWHVATSSTLVAALGVAVHDVVAIEQYGTDIICHVIPTAFADMTPNFSLLLALECRATIVTCAAPVDSGYDFYSRFFGPRSGVHEDPVTGSAHCALAPYWATLLPQASFRGRQKSARGGDVSARVAGDRVFLFGTAVLTLRGTLLG